MRLSSARHAEAALPRAMARKRARCDLGAGSRTSAGRHPAALIGHLEQFLGPPHQQSGIRKRCLRRLGIAGHELAAAVLACNPPAKVLDSDVQASTAGGTFLDEVRLRHGGISFYRGPAAHQTPQSVRKSETEFNETRSIFLSSRQIILCNTRQGRWVRQTGKEQTDPVRASVPKRRARPSPLAVGDRGPPSVGRWQISRSGG